MQKKLRQPIVCVLGHVDSGKTTLLDTIRGSAVALREVGSMTQHIGASFFPIETLRTICGPLAKNVSKKIKIKGLLVIDTPGHSIFINLRKRGGSVADIAILVIDVLKGFEPQTLESLTILRNRKTPFVVAANKIDVLPGWMKHHNTTFFECFNKQKLYVQKKLDNLLYVLMGSFSRLGYKANRFDRVTNFTKTIAIVPVSAKTGEGIPELIAVLIGLIQQYMKRKLLFSEGQAKGTILEVKEEVGLGTTLDTIIYNGILNKGDTIVLAGSKRIIITKVRAILLPKPLDEIRDPKEKFSLVKSVSAAAGVKIIAPDVDDAISGSSLYSISFSDSPETLVNIISEEVEALRINTDKNGVILKTDTLGSLEAIVQELEKNEIPVRLADVGDVSRRDIIEASMIKRVNSFLGVLLAFNVRILPDAETEAKIQKIPLFCHNVIYRLIDDYYDWVQTEKKVRKKKKIEALIYPGKISVIPGLVFRKSKPAVFGVEIISGKIKPKYSLVSIEGSSIGEISQIQDKGVTISEAIKGMKVAVSIKEIVVGRNLNEGDILYVAVPEHHVKEFLLKYTKELAIDDIQVLNELIVIMRKKHVIWGV